MVDRLRFEGHDEEGRPFFADVAGNIAPGARIEGKIDSLGTFDGTDEKRSQHA